MEIAKYAIELSWKEFNVSLDTLHAWLQANAGSEYAGISADSKLRVWFKNEPQEEEKEAIAAHWDGIQSDSSEATAYTQKAAAASIKAQVVAINAFSSDLLNQFAAENIAMGITADGKTEDVLDTMLPVMSALQGGAPTIAIKRAKAIAPSEYDSKYVTAARLKSYVNKIEAFLGLPLSNSL